MTKEPGIDARPTPMPGPLFDDIRHDIAEEAGGLSIDVSAGGERLTLDQEYALFRVASRGVLEVLSGQGVEDARTLARELDLAAEDDPLTDIYAVAAGHEHRMLAGDHDRISWGIQNRLARLAYVTGKTAQAAMAVTLGKPKALDSLRRARHEVLEYERPATSLAGYSLHALLDRAEAVPLGRADAVGSEVPEKPEQLAA